MAFNWAEYLNLAQALAAPATFNAATLNADALARCAISRAYYAAFCHARNYARDRHGLLLRYNGDDHSLIKRHFLQRRAHGVAHKLDKLRSLRNESDYADAASDLPAKLADALAEAQKVIAILK
ncbi:MAG: DNA-binding protein [Acidobacteria bacterium]|nr:DNA-binding protein [Acidobacteriota bacterium]